MSTCIGLDQPLPWLSVCFFVFVFENRGSGRGGVVGGRGLSEWFLWSLLLANVPYARHRERNKNNTPDKLNRNIRIEQIKTICFSFQTLRFSFSFSHSYCFYFCWFLSHVLLLFSFSLFPFDLYFYCICILFFFFSVVFCWQSTTVFNLMQLATC